MKPRLKKIKSDLCVLVWVCVCVCACVCVCVCVFWVRSLRVSQQESLIQFSFHGDSGGTICPFFFFFFPNKRGRRQIHCGSFSAFLRLNHYLDKAITWQTSQNRQTGPAEPPQRPAQHVSALSLLENRRNDWISTSKMTEHVECVAGFSAFSSSTFFCFF